MQIFYLWYFTSVSSRPTSRESAESRDKPQRVKVKGVEDEYSFDRNERSHDLTEFVDDDLSSDEDRSKRSADTEKKAEGRSDENRIFNAEDSNEDNDA